jgi:flagellar hook-associated protein 3 FlgL
MLSGAVNQHQNNAFRLQQQISSGQKVKLASDDPGAYEMIRKLTSDQNRFDQFQRNADMAVQYLSSTGQRLDQSINLFHRINELAIQASDGTLDPGSRTVLAQEAGNSLESLLSIANATANGQYIFAGLRTDTEPYEAIRDPDTGRITDVIYHGSEETRAIRTEDSLTIPTNTAGSTQSSEGGVFQTATRDLFGSIIDLQDALYRGENVAEGPIMEKLEDDLSHLLNQASLTGAREQQVRTHRSYVLDLQATQLQSLDSLQSVDLAKAYMEMSESENAYQAALYSSSQMMNQVSLLNFI